jgi:signal peptidase I
MVSVCFIFVATLALWLLRGFLLAFCARILGSPRGWVGVGIAVSFCLIAMGIAFLALDVALAGLSVLMNLARIGMLIVFICITFALFKFAFRLSAGRVWALFGIYISWSVMELIFAVLVVKPYIAEAFIVPTASMSPTIEPRDRIVAEKLLHPHRWDIVAYRHAEDNGRTSVYCKRLVGQPGERLRFENGEIYVNDQAMTAPAVVAGRYHASPFQQPDATARYHDGQTIVLGSDEYFLIGDNVSISADSRIYGPSSASTLVGVADLKYWPPGRVHILR